MRVTPVPDEDVWDDHVRMVIAGPDGDLTGDIRPVEALVATLEHGPAFTMRIVCDPGEAERLAVGEPFYLTLYGDHLHPFSVAMAEVAG